MDNADRAEQLDTERREKAIAAVRAQAHQQGTAICIICGEDIPVARRKAYPAAVRCIDCQQRYERGAR